MSAIGTKRTFPFAPHMSALGLIADIERTPRLLCRPTRSKVHLRRLTKNHTKYCQSAAAFIKGQLRILARRALHLLPNCDEEGHCE